MYWSIQEKVIFSIVFFVVFCVQVTTVLIFRDISSATQYVLILGFNLFVFLGMIYYAKWVWKLKAFLTALKKVIIYEVIFILFSIAFLIVIKLQLIKSNG